ncbi:MAG: response regulator [Myxococcota bacterium]|nr:response regulator [Myxococcota bacterium]
MSKNVLIVDDENYIRLLLRRTLEDFEFAGVEIRMASDGQAGLDAARERRPDLMFLDLMMPTMDGHQVCLELKGDPQYRDIPIVILTAKGQLPTFPENAQPEHCLTKPFDPDQIVELAQSILGIDLDLD